LGTCRERQLSSEIGFMGICRKVLLFVLVGVDYTLDMTMLGSGSALRTATILFYLSNEGLSIVEKYRARMGLSDRLQEVLK
jgi:phage-related holin